MPNIKSAIKRSKTSKQQNARNRMAKSVIRTSVRKFNAAVDSNDPNAEQFMRSAVQVIDKAAAKNIIHKNAAAHKKAQLARKLSSAN